MDIGKGNIKFSCSILKHAHHTFNLRLKFQAKENLGTAPEYRLLKQQTVRVSLIYQASSLHCHI